MVKLSPVGMQAVALGAVIALAAVNIVGVRFGARLMQWLTVLKVGALLLIAVLWLALFAFSETPSAWQQDVAGARPSAS